jgi:hypothetical protein
MMSFRYTWQQFFRDVWQLWFPPRKPEEHVNEETQCKLVADIGVTRK